MGGGTGTFMVLSGLKKYKLDLTAIVAMSDNGGSTGVLRDELGVLPPGDVRQCLVALSTSDKLMRQLMNYRFSQGQLKGHNFGNLFLSALEKITGSFDKAVEKVSEIMRIEGEVIPATLDEVELIAYMNTGKIVRGQAAISDYDLARMDKIILEPEAKANPKAIKALKEADLIVIGPGDLYSSLIPNLLIDDISQAVASSSAKKVYICNLMNKAGQTDNFKVSDYVKTIEKYLNSSLDYIIYNTEKPTDDLVNLYAREREKLVEYSKGLNLDKYIGTDLINKNLVSRKKEMGLKEL